MALVGIVTKKASGVSTEWYFMVLDSIFLSIYVIEAVLKLIALGVEYFYDPWNNLGGWVGCGREGAIELLGRSLGHKRDRDGMLA